MVAGFGVGLVLGSGFGFNQKWPTGTGFGIYLNFTQVSRSPDGNIFCLILVVQSPSFQQ